MRNTEKAEELWNKEQTAWWPEGPSDPNVRVIRFDPERAELWDGPKNSAVASYEFKKARATGEPPNLGENLKSTVDMD
ncbi:pyridoxamine 5'-phosphate oxidase family protein [Methyloligella solikamskensis]|uniref:Pyridoxamine 5'-phosphate oxidase family protein n=1 Tax=Methyloligella solikamskensis TaxID=1177756 RepID=A0ABW3J5Y6_9HYPH